MTRPILEDPKVREALSALTGVNYNFCSDRLPPAEEALLSAVRAAHLAELAGEPETETKEKVIIAMEGLFDGSLTLSSESLLAAMYPILRAPLVAENQQLKQRLADAERGVAGMQAKLLTGDNSVEYARVVAENQQLRDRVQELEGVSCGYCRGLKRLAAKVSP